MIDHLPHSRSIRLGALLIVLIAIAQRVPATPGALACAAGRRESRVEWKQQRCCRGIIGPDRPATG